MIEIDRPPLTKEQALSAIWQMLYPGDEMTPEPDMVVEQLRGFLAQKERELNDASAEAVDVQMLREEHARFKAELEHVRAAPTRKIRTNKKEKADHGT